MKNLLAIPLLVLFTGCLTTQKAEDFLKKKGKLDDVCASAFPVNDSVGAPIVDSIKPAENPDYTPIIQGLNTRIENLVQELGQHRDTAAQQSYQKQLLQLQLQIRALKEAYKPCTPDTVFSSTPVYRRDRAYEQVLQDQLAAMEKELGQKEVQIGVLNDQLERMTEKKNWWRKWGGIVTWSIIGGLLLIAVVPRLALLKR